MCSLIEKRPRCSLLEPLGPSWTQPHQVRKAAAARRPQQSPGVRREARTGGHWPPSGHHGVTWMGTGRADAVRPHPQPRPRSLPPVATREGDAMAGFSFLSIPLWQRASWSSLSGIRSTVQSTSRGKYLFFNLLHIFLLEYHGTIHTPSRLPSSGSSATLGSPLQAK